MNGKDAHPLYTFLKKETKSGDIKWNYTKFLVDRKGVPVKCFGSLFDPIDFEDDVRAPLTFTFYSKIASGVLLRSHRACQASR